MSLDKIVSDLLSLKLRHEPRTEDAHSGIRGTFKGQWRLHCIREAFGNGATQNSCCPFASFLVVSRQGRQRGAHGSPPPQAFELSDGSPAFARG